MTDPKLDALARTLAESRVPRKFAVEVSAHCNLRCTMCHHPQMRRPKGRMPLELWRKCADQLARDWPQSEVWFSFCGEPLVEPQRLLEMLAYGRTVGLRSMNINTNGLLLTEELVEPLLDSGVALIVFGIDGFTRPTYERLRVGGDLALLEANLGRLLAARRARGAGPEIQAQFIEMDENQHELADFQRHWLARGATVKVRNRLSWGGTFSTPLCVPAAERIPCPWAVTMMHVFWDGRVPRCPGDTEGEEGVGNAWDEPLSTLWSELGGYRAKHLERRFDELPARCQACQDWMVGAAQRVRPQPESTA